MTAADRRARLSDAVLYLCTDSRSSRGDLVEFLHAALRGGVDVVQLREKHLEAREELGYAEMFAEVAGQHGALWSVNDRADLALASGTDVLHLGQDDLPVHWARRVIGPEPLVGRSTHDRAQVDAAVRQDAVDYFCVGPCWPTPTKPGRAAPGLELVRHAARVAPPDRPGTRPWFAIGGIDADRLDEVVAAGARRVVVVRAITEADDPEAAARALRSRLVAAG